MNTPTRENLKALYLELIGTDVELKAHVDDLVRAAIRDAKRLNPLFVAARTLTAQAGHILGEKSSAVTEETWLQGGFLHGHIFHRYGRARAVVAKHLGQAWAEEWLRDTAN